VTSVHGYYSFALPVWGNTGAVRFATLTNPDE
jgi:hypothetical protein